MADTRSRASSSLTIEAIDFEDDVFVVVVDDLSSWEFIEASDDDEEEEDRFSFQESEADLGSNDGEKKEDSVRESLESFGSPSSDVLTHALSDKLEHYRGDDESTYDHRDDGAMTYDVYEDENEDDDDRGFDVDDDLVPWSVSDRFGKQRMKKSGKKGHSKSKMRRLKSVPCYHYNRPGGIVGKRDAGVYAF